MARLIINVEVGSRPQGSINPKVVPTLQDAHRLAGVLNCGVRVPIVNYIQEYVRVVWPEDSLDELIEDHFAWVRENGPDVLLRDDLGELQRNWIRRAIAEARVEEVEWFKSQMGSLQTAAQ